jgi:hypothetical protein
MFEGLFAADRSRVKYDARASKRLVEPDAERFSNCRARLALDGARAAMLDRFVDRGRDLGHLADAANARHLLDLLEDRSVALAACRHRLGRSVI